MSVASVNDIDVSLEIQYDAVPSMYWKRPRIDWELSANVWWPVGRLGVFLEQ